MIKNIHIQGFRGINDLEINDFKTINLFLGMNNCGKTTILEALFLLTGISNPELVLNIHKFRNLILTENDDFRFLFNKLDFKSEIEISGRFKNNESRSLKIKPIYKNGIKEKSDKGSLFENLQLSTTSSIKNVGGIKFDIEINNKRNQESKKYNSELMLDGGNVFRKRPEK